MNITAYAVRKIKATAKRSNECHWIELEICERYATGTERSSSVTLFTEGPEAARLVEDYVQAINSVNADEPAQAEAAE